MSPDFNRQVGQRAEASKVQTRLQMTEFLDARMNSTYAALREGKELAPDTSLVKTYLLEAHLPDSAPRQELLSLLNKSFAPNIFGKDIIPRIDETDEELFFRVSLSVYHAKLREQVYLFIDCSSTRFWLVHSMNSSTSLDWLLQRLIGGTQDIDRAWIPADLLEKMATYGSFRGLSLDYERQDEIDDEIDSAETPVKSLKMHLWGNKAKNILEMLRNEKAFPHETTLSKVKVKYSLINRTDFTLSDIKYSGKITARGTSFRAHASLINSLHGDYSLMIKNIEKRFAISYSADGNSDFVRGQPINFFYRRMHNISAFVQHVFSGAQPFKLWGIPILIGKEFYRVTAIDLHIGKRLYFEVAPDFMRVYLPAGSCGNSIMRLFTNLQHHYDARVRAEDGDGVSYVSF